MPDVSKKKVAAKPVRKDKRANKKKPVSRKYFKKKRAIRNLHKRKDTKVVKDVQ